MMTCRICKKDKELSEFYEITVKNKQYLRHDCKKCFNSTCNKNGRDKKRKRIRENRNYAVKKLGGICSICGYCENLNVLVFHHPNGRDHDKKRTISKLKDNTGENARKKLDKELEKCVLLCSNCHLDIHYPNRKK